MGDEGREKFQISAEALCYKGTRLNKYSRKFTNLLRGSSNLKFRAALKLQMKPLKVAIAAHTFLLADKNDDGCVLAAMMIKA